MPPRRKPASSKQKKAELKVKRAIKRGDLPPDAAINASSKRGRRPPHGKQPLAPNVDASRRLESSFVKFSPEFLEKAKRKSSVLPAIRPITADKLLFPVETHTLNHSTATALDAVPTVTVLKRPKWRYEMSKKEVESNEVGVYKKWLEGNDRIIQAWKAEETTPEDVAGSSENSEKTAEESVSPQLTNTPDRMPYAPPLFERNLEVWRQL